MYHEDEQEEVKDKEEVEAPLFDFLTTDEVAEMLRLSPSTVTDRRKAGDLPYVEIGRRVFFHKKDLIDYVKRCEVNTLESNNV